MISLDERANENDVLRVHFEKGWTSATASDGSTVLVVVTEAEMAPESKVAAAKALFGDGDDDDDDDDGGLFGRDDADANDDNAEAQSAVAAAAAAARAEAALIEAAEKEAEAARLAAQTAAAKVALAKKQQVCCGFHQSIVPSGPPMCTYECALFRRAV